MFRGPLYGKATSEEEWIMDETWSRSKVNDQTAMINNQWSKVMDRTAVISKQQKAVNYNSCFDAVLGTWTFNARPLRRHCRWCRVFLLQCFFHFIPCCGGFVLILWWPAGSSAGYLGHVGYFKIWNIQIVNFQIACDIKHRNVNIFSEWINI